MNDMFAYLLGRRRGGGDGGGDGGGAAYTSGTIVPVGEVHEIEHGLGKVPTVFMWYIDSTVMTGRVMGSTSRVFEDETAFNSADWRQRGYAHRPVFILANGVLFSYSNGNSTDWGYYTKGTVSTATQYKIVCDETKFSCNYANNGLVPYSENGNITVHWFAMG